MDALAAHAGLVAGLPQTKQHGVATNKTACRCGVATGLPQTKQHAAPAQRVLLQWPPRPKDGSGKEERVQPWAPWPDELNRCTL
jgi:hypothetical protein